MRRLFFKPKEKLSKDELMMRLVGVPIVYNGKVYRAIKFDDLNTRVLPCGDCSFGGTHENPQCFRPGEFPYHCTCMHREDHTNVFFREEVKRIVDETSVCRLRRCKPIGRRRRRRIKKYITTRK